MSRTSIDPHCVGTMSAFLEAAVQDLPDLIVLESEATDLPAVPICTRLRSDERTRDMPIIVLVPPGKRVEELRRAGCTAVIDDDVDGQTLQEQIAGALGLQLRRYERHPIVLPVARGRIFHEFLGYSNALSEGGMGFDTIARVRAGDHYPLRIYRGTTERPISVLGRVCWVRPNIDTGIGYAVGVEFVRLSSPDRGRLRELFPTV